ncbi:HD domain-containing phosphohydrolase [Paenibacillus alkaliterrae]|uniref:HD domain-containing phosphohydrolase n=1 Tax=Paenibacillus alkaliterrae TaxID=320909 RepID=UPI0038B38F7B
MPLAGRIAAITDTYSALTSNRLYSKALNKDEAIEIMLHDKEKFDPNILDYFVTKITAGGEEREELI